MSLADLQPCPFCKGPAVLDGGSDSVRVRCEGCGATGSPRFFNGDDDDAIEQAELEATAAWNTRHPLAA